MTWRRHSQRVTQSARWKRLRKVILRRDDYRCVKCGKIGELEIDHIQPVRVAPDLAFEPSNLQALCKPCHSTKTQYEIFGGRGPDPERLKWKALLRDI